jgi:hypothetical protein
MIKLAKTLLADERTEARKLKKVRASAAGILFVYFVYFVVLSGCRGLAHSADRSQ